MKLQFTSFNFAKRFNLIGFTICKLDPIEFEYVLFKFEFLKFSKYKFIAPGESVFPKDHFAKSFT